METRGLGLPAVVGIIVVIAVVAATVLLLSGGAPGVGAPISTPEGALIFDDFDDQSLGSNFSNTSAGMMGGYPPDLNNFEFVQVGEGSALKFTVDVPQGAWSGYWSFMVPGDISTEPISVSIGNGYDVSGRSELRMAVRADGQMQFKIELQDTLQFSDAQAAQLVFTQSSSTNAQQAYGKTPAQLAEELFGVAPENIGTLSNEDVHNNTLSHNASVHRNVGTTWEEITIPLSEFTSGSNLNLSDLRQLNIIFEGGTAGVSGSLYIDWIAFV